MLIPFINKKKEDEYIFETSDILIVFDSENRTSDIKRVTAITNGAVISAPFYNIPIEDLDITTGAEGRNFFYKAPTESIKETERLARLEMDMVLRQITAYNQPTQAPNMGIVKWILFVFLFISLIGLMFK